MKSAHAIVRICASCSWVFRSPAKASAACPKCGSASIGARHARGPMCYQFERTQVPWIEKKVSAHRRELAAQVKAEFQAARTGQTTIKFIPDHGPLEAHG